MLFSYDGCSKQHRDVVLRSRNGRTHTAMYSVLRTEYGVLTDMLLRNTPTAKNDELLVGEDSAVVETRQRQGTIRQETNKEAVRPQGHPPRQTRTVGEVGYGLPGLGVVGWLG